MAALNLGTATVECPVCKKPWTVKLKASMVIRNGRPGKALVRVSTAKPIRVPREHRDCIAKVD